MLSVLQVDSQGGDVPDRAAGHVQQKASVKPRLSGWDWLGQRTPSQRTSAAQSETLMPQVTSPMLIIPSLATVRRFSSHGPQTQRGRSSS